MDYGYPSGTQLKDMILSKSNIPYAIKHSNFNMSEEMRLNSEVEIFTFLKSCGYSFDQIHEFREQFERSPKSSIDAFLENRPEFLQLGKLLISMCILSCEHDSTLFINKNKHKSWYHYIFNLMTPSWADFTENKLSIITYNYDRSFEVFFIKALMSTFGKSFDECVQAFTDTIKIIHVHGRIADIGTGMKEYIPQLFTDDVTFAASQLKIIHEEEQINKVYSFVNRELIDAEQVFILGFGFDERNLKRLKLERCRAPIFATRKGISELNLHRINHLAKNKVIFTIHDHGIVDFFEKCSSLHGYMAEYMKRQVGIKIHSF